jgi:hypothetical protein
MTTLDHWLKRATRSLSADSAARVRTEILDHYESARDAAISRGATVDEASGHALTALGDARAANREYRRVLLTAAEAKVLRDGGRESRFVCSRAWLKQLLLGAPIAALAAAIVLLLAGATDAGRTLLAGGLAMGVVLAAPFLPVYTPSRARVVRWVKWMTLVGAMLLAFWPEILKWSWLIASSLWPAAWIEWVRVSIRRKLRAEDWPRHLYL